MDIRILDSYDPRWLLRFACFVAIGWLLLLSILSAVVLCRGGYSLPGIVVSNIALALYAATEFLCLFIATVDSVREQNEKELRATVVVGCAMTPLAVWQIILW